MNVKSATLALAALLAAAPAAAQTVETRSQTVQLGDIDLKSPAGQAVMRQRIERAAGRVCGGRPDSSPMALKLHVTWQTCKAASMNRAFAEVEAKTGRAYAERVLEVVSR